MQRLIYTTVLLVSFFLMGNAVHAYFMEIDGGNNYLYIDGGGANVLETCGGPPAGAPPRAKGMSKLGLGLKI